MNTLGARLADAAGALSQLAGLSRERNFEGISADLDPILRTVETATRILIAGVGKALTRGQLQKLREPERASEHLPTGRVLCEPCVLRTLLG